MFHVTEVVTPNAAKGHVTSFFSKGMSWFGVFFIFLPGFGLFCCEPCFVCPLLFHWGPRELSQRQTACCEGVRCWAKPMVSCWRATSSPPDAREFLGLQPGAVWPGASFWGTGLTNRPDFSKQIQGYGGVVFRQKGPQDRCSSSTTCGWWQGWSKGTCRVWRSKTPWKTSKTQWWKTH